MSTIRLKNIKIYAFHGCMKEEGQIGSDYLVNVTVKANLDKASKTDRLQDTIDYVLLQKIVVEEMAIRSKLLEHVCNRIINRIMLLAPEVKTVKVTVSKINPPIGGDVAQVGVCLKRSR